MDVVLASQGRCPNGTVKFFRVGICVWTIFSHVLEYEQHLKCFTSRTTDSVV